MTLQPRGDDLEVLQYLCSLTWHPWPPRLLATAPLRTVPRFLFQQSTTYEWSPGSISWFSLRMGTSWIVCWWAGVWRTDGTEIVAV